jgi:hypothetical protein
VRYPDPDELQRLVPVPPSRPKHQTARERVAVVAAALALLFIALFTAIIVRLFA